MGELLCGWTSLYPSLAESEAPEMVIEVVSSIYFLILGENDRVLVLKEMPAVI